MGDELKVARFNITFQLKLPTLILL